MKYLQKLKADLEKDPTNHWLLTQIGVIYYEQRRYKMALSYFNRSLLIMPSCPLTLWNYAGCLSALNHQLAALDIYKKLIKNKKFDPCWESPEWTQSLKNDCVYRMGICYEEMEYKSRAIKCFNLFLKNLKNGIDSIYTEEDVERQFEGMKND